MNDGIITYILSYDVLSTFSVSFVILVGILILLKDSDKEVETIVIPKELLHDYDEEELIVTGEVKSIPKRVNSVDDIKNTFENYN